MKPEYTDLYLGVGTVIDGQDIFNHRFSTYHDFNFTYLKDDIDDYDLFHLIQEERESNRNHKKDFVTFILPAYASDRYDLFDTLNFTIEAREILHLQTKHFKPSPMAKPYTIKVLEEDDLQQWIDFNFDFKEPEDTPFEKQKLDLLNQEFKQKNIQIIIAKDGDKIIASLTVIIKKQFIEFDAFYTLEDYQQQGIGSAMQAFAMQGHDDVVLVSESNTESNAMYLRQGYKVVTSIYKCYQTF